MKQTEHTKGEWTVNNAVIETKNKHGDTDTVICTMNEEMLNSSGYSFSETYNKEAKANAEMICRAVNNYETLKDIVERTLSYLKTFEYTRLSDAEEDLHDRCEAVLDALKAETNKEEIMEAASEKMRDIYLDGQMEAEQLEQNNFCNITEDNEDNSLTLWHTAILAKNQIARIIRDGNFPMSATMFACLQDIEKVIGEGNQPSVQSITESKYV